MESESLPSKRIHHRMGSFEEEEEDPISWRRWRNQAIGNRQGRKILRERGIMDAFVRGLNNRWCVKDAACLIGSFSTDGSIEGRTLEALREAMHDSISRGDGHVSTRCALSWSTSLLGGDGKAMDAATDAIECLKKPCCVERYACMQLLASAARMDARSTRLCQGTNVIVDVLERLQSIDENTNLSKDALLLEATLRAAAEITRPPLSMDCARLFGTLIDTLAFLSREGTKITRLQSSRALAHLGITAQKEQVLEDVEKNQELARSVWRTALPTLLSMVDARAWDEREDEDDTRVLEEAARAVGELVSIDQSVAMRVAQGDAVPRLAELLGKANTKTRAGRRVFASAMMAIAELCMVDESSRKQLVESEGALGKIVDVLHDPRVEPELLKLACSCIRSLSRSVKQLRTHLMEAEIAQALLKIVLEPSQASERVLSDAVSSLCNLVLDFSPMKQAIVNAGGVVRFAEIANLRANEVSDLSINALWALKNLSYLATHQIKKSVLEFLPWTDVQAALQKECVSINSPALKFQLLAIFRNLTFGGAEDVSLVLHYAGHAQFARVIMQLLREARDPCMVLEQALFVLCNVATGNEGHKQLLVDEGIGEILANYLSDQGTNEQRVAAAWCTINLVWREPHQEKRRKRPGIHGRKSRSSFESTGDGTVAATTNAAARAAALTSAGVDLRLHALASAQSPDVRDRARTALDLLAMAETPA